MYSIRAEALLGAWICYEMRLAAFSSVKAMDILAYAQAQSDTLETIREMSTCTAHFKR